MKKPLLICFLIYCTCYAYAQPSANNPAVVLKDANSCINYYYYTIKLSRNFLATNELSKPITKAAFLQALQTGKYMPLQVPQKSNALHYQLYRFTPAQQKLFGGIIAAYTQDNYRQYQMEGKQFPAFKFIDIKGNVYTNQNTKGKIVVIKAWFLACTACVNEIPELNQLTAAYKNRNDILFLSVLPDSAVKLISFLTKKPFHDYAQIAGNNYFDKIFPVSAFPTHFVINKQGLIVKVLGDARDLAFAINAEASK